MGDSSVERPGAAMTPAQRRMWDAMQAAVQPLYDALREQAVQIEQLRATHERRHRRLEAHAKDAAVLREGIQQALPSIEAIIEHAKLDRDERGIREAERYVGLAQDALDRLQGRDLDRLGRGLDSQATTP